MDSDMLHTVSVNSLIIRRLFIFLFTAYSFLTGSSLLGQSYSLDQVVLYAKENAPDAMKISTSKENKYWQWRTFRSEYKPQLILNATLPAYQNKNIPVIQEDGSIVYQKVDQSSTALVLSLEQNIGLTGSKIYISSDINRFDNFNQDITNYSGSPFYIGFEQPLFAFNELKWMKRIEPLKYKESLKEYIEGNEEIAYNTTIRYFNLLLSQVKYEIAQTNKANADTIYMIGMEKYELGRISRNELLQLKYGVISAQKAMATASLSIKTTLLELTSYTGLSEIETVILTLPDKIHRFSIDDSVAIEKAVENSRYSIEFQREVLEARRNAEQARRESNLNADISVSYGQTNAAGNLSGIYNHAQTMQTLSVGLSVPILDWGRSKAIRKTAEADLKMVEYTVKQDEINFRQEIITEIENFRMLQDFVDYTAEADLTAAERYEIARLRYLAEDISLTEYNIALSEKDQAKQDYIMALRDYWMTYYTIRILTLYDFKNDIQL